MRTLMRVLLLTVAAGAVAVGSRAQEAPDGERILSFRSEIAVRPDASLEVRETIRARAEGAEIRRGIYRDFPTTYERPGGGEHRVAFDVVEVLRDGSPEPWHTAPADNGVRVYIGDKDTFVGHGEHTWVLTYRTDRQVGFFEEHDELYWNVTGNGWVFPIDEAEAVVTLPADPGGPVRNEAFTGPQGSKERAYTASWEAAMRTATIRATRALAPREGLTIVVSFPKGIVAAPSDADRLRWAVRDNRAAFAGGLGLLVVLLYYAVAWVRVGRDPERGVIVVGYDPPQGLSPAAVRYLRRGRFDTKAFAADVVRIAVKGHLSIDRAGGAYTLRAMAPGREPLTPEETRIVAKLFGGKSTVELTQANHSRVGGAVSLLRRHLRASIDKVHLVMNRGHLAAGVGLSVLAVAAAVLAEPAPRAAAGGFLSLWLLGWTIGVATLLVNVVRSWRDVLSGVGSRAAAAVRAVFVTLFAIPFVGAEVFVLGLLAAQGSAAAVLVLVLLGGINVLFFHLLKAPTASGRTLLDRIEGFERFLAATEADRINRIEGPERTPALYERLLPYAIALDLEERWSEQFADVLARAAQEAPGGRPGMAWSPAWYHGDFGGAGWSPSSFAGSIGAGFSGAISSSSSAPGSSSGSSGGGGGGGSSGGGGGGGGGGGW